MTSCQISLAAMRLFKSYFAYCFSFVFLKQEIWSEGTIKKSINAVVRWRKKVATMRGLLYKIQHKSITFLLKCRVGLPSLHAMFVGEINYKHFADSRTVVPGGFITSITSKKSSNQKSLRIIDRFVFNNQVVNKACVVGVWGQTADNKHTGSMIFPFFLLLSKTSRWEMRLLKTSQ